MRAVIQRSKQAFVTVNGHETGRIEQGLVILIGVTHGDTEQDYMNAARPEPASLLYDKCNEILRQFGILVETGVFGEMMDVSLCNWGPVTLLIDSAN
jgi:D-tyrosyl-tRNA(Tyr) deacylase